MRVAVTGASGFVGRHLMQTLHAEHIAARGLVRQTGTQKTTDELVAVDYQNTDELADKLAGCNTLIHLVGKTHGKDGNHWNDFCAVNVEISRKVAIAAQRVGVKRFIYLSSVKALGESTAPGQPFTNASEPNPEDYYGRSKLLAEYTLHNQFKLSDTELIIVRPPLIWGEAPKGNLAAILQWARTGVPLPLGGIKNRRHWVSADLLCGFLTHLATCSQALSNLPPLLVSDRRPLSTSEAIAQMLQTMDLQARFFSLPSMVWRLAAHTPGLRTTVAKLTGSLEVDAEDTWTLTHWHPKELERKRP